MTNADWITEKISEFFVKNEIRIFKINAIIFVLSLTLLCVTKIALFIPILIFSFVLTIGFGTDVIDEWMKKEHKEDVMDILTVANKVEEELKKWKMVGDRIGSGFDCQTNTRDVQYMYGEEKDQESITNLITDVVSNFEGEWSVSIRYKLDDFTFYISPKE